MSFRRSFFKNVITLGGYNYGSQILNFLSSIVLSRLLLPEEYGFVALIMVFTGFIIIFADAGLSYAVIRSDYGRTYQKVLQSLSIWIGIGLSILLILLAYPIALFYGDMELVIPTIFTSLLFVTKSLSIIPVAILSKNLDFNFLGKAKMSETIISITLMIILALLGFSYWSLIIAQVFSPLALFFMARYRLNFGFYIYNWKFIKFGFQKTKSLIGNITGFNIINYWARNADNLIIGKFYGSASLGIYNRAYRMLQLALTLITGLFGTVLYPSLKDLESKGGNINKEYANILGVISILSFPIALVLILFPDTIVYVLWGNNWMKVANLLPYFGLLIISQTLLSTNGSVFVLLNKERMVMLLGGITSVILVFSIVIGSLISVEGVAVFYALGYIGLVLPISVYYSFYKSFGFEVREIINFWTPKFVLSLSVLFSLWFRIEWLKLLSMLLLMIHIIYYQRNDIRSFTRLIKENLAKRKSIKDTKNGK
ncbi:MAG: oligosaccharide flippase family protein [Bacteroidota bacterium]